MLHPRVVHVPQLIEGTTFSTAFFHSLRQSYIFRAQNPGIGSSAGQNIFDSQQIAVATCVEDFPLFLFHPCEILMFWLLVCLRRLYASIVHSPTKMSARSALAYPSQDVGRWCYLKILDFYFIFSIADISSFRWCLVCMLLAFLYPMYQWRRNEQALCPDSVSNLSVHRRKSHTNTTYRTGAA